MRLRAEHGRLLRVGHKGAAALAPENTLASLEAALAHGVDLVEFDVLPHGGELVLAHSAGERRPDAPSLDEALAFLAARAPHGIGLDLDLKEAGCEEDVVAALRRHGLVERTVVCSFFGSSVARVKELEPALATGFSYPWDRRGLSERRWATPVVKAGIIALRAALPVRIAGMLRRSRADAAMINHQVLSRALVRRCHDLGAAVFAWTVDDPGELERVVSTGVDGVISNDPRIFGR